MYIFRDKFKIFGTYNHWKTHCGTILSNAARMPRETVLHVSEQFSIGTLKKGTSKRDIVRVPKSSVCTYLHGIRAWGVSFDRASNAIGNPSSRMSGMNNGRINVAETRAKSPPAPRWITRCGLPRAATKFTDCTWARKCIVKRKREFMAAIGVTIRQRAITQSDEIVVIVEECDKSVPSCRFSLHIIAARRTVTTQRRKKLLC